MSLDQIGEAFKQRIEVAVLAGLHQTEVALGEMHRLLARNGSEDRKAERRDGRFDHTAMPIAADAIENEAGDVSARIMGSKTAHERRGRLRLAGDIENEQHG